MMSRDNDRLTGHKDRDPIPDEFASVSEAGVFWDTHDLADYEDQTRETAFNVDLRPPHAVKKSPPKL